MPLGRNEEHEKGILGNDKKGYLLFVTLLFVTAIKRLEDAYAENCFSQYERFAL